MLIYDTGSRIQTGVFHLKGSCACLLWSKRLQTNYHWDPLLSSKYFHMLFWMTFFFPQAGRCTVTLIYTYTVATSSIKYFQINTMGNVENTRMGIIKRFVKRGTCQNKLWMLKFYIRPRRDYTCTRKRLFEYPETMFGLGNSWVKNHWMLGEYLLGNIICACPILMLP